MKHDIIVIGGGISGLSAAWRAAQAGRQVLVLEQGSALGGCISTHSEPLSNPSKGPDFWFEMGAHTTYNSYQGLVELIQGAGLVEKVVQRGPARIHFGLLRDGQYIWLTPYKVLLQLNWFEAALRFPFNVWRSKNGQTVSSYYSRLIGPGNFSRVLSPFFAAVPSQSADAFPVTGPGSLFKKRARCEEMPRSFGIEGGLQTICDALGQVSGIDTRLETSVAGVSQTENGMSVTLTSGELLEAKQVVLATPINVTRDILSEAFPTVSEALSSIQTVAIESQGITLDKTACWMPECAFVVPVNDDFYSMVTRDPFPHSHRRGFCFHFRAGLNREAMLTRMSDILRVPAETLGTPVIRRTVLPSPRLGQEEIVRRVDAALMGLPLGVTGNFFAGLAIEDCIQRSFSEWQRLQAIG